MRRYERASTLLTSNRPVDDWGKLLGDTAAVTALLDRLLHHAHVLKCGPRSWRTKVQTDLRTEDGDEVELTGLDRPPKWPVLRCRLMAGFQMSTEGIRTYGESAPIVVGQLQASAPQLAAKHTILFKQITKDISFLAIQPLREEHEQQLERGGGEHGRSLYHGPKVLPSSVDPVMGHYAEGHRR